MGWDPDQGWRAGVATCFPGQRTRRALSIKDPGHDLCPHTALVAALEEEAFGIRLGLFLCHGPVGHPIRSMGPPQITVFIGINYTRLERQPAILKYSYPNMK